MEEVFISFVLLHLIMLVGFVFYGNILCFVIAIMLTVLVSYLMKSLEKTKCQ